jgi:3-phenylpropionate/trans-cinnamate dioxygenase ferredoxin subunit
LLSDNAIVFFDFYKNIFTGAAGKFLYNLKMPRLVEIAELSKLHEDRPLQVFPLGLPVLLIRRGERVFAVENRCAHMGCPLAAGRLEGYILQCPCHDWRFDIRDGKFLDAPELFIKAYAVQLRDGKILLEIAP